ncbi:MAG: helicase-related protein, partial [Cellulosimicrobium cellulans]
FVSATPGDYERSHSARIVEQIVRPTGIVDPRVEVRETRNQIDDLMNEIRIRVDRDERTLVTTLTKKMAEDLTDYLLEMGFRVRYLHSEIDTLERIQIIRELRLGEFDILVGVNLLREGLDLPEVSLVAILDADKEGFLRSPKSLIQTIGRAARNVSGQVHMYADKITPAMAAAIEETERRRERQIAYNTEHGVDPTPLRKRISDVTDMLAREDVDTAELLAGGYRQPGKGAKGRAPVPGAPKEGASSGNRLAGAAASDLAELIQELSDQMHAAAGELQFELAARLRDEISGLKKELRQMQAATA